MMSILAEISEHAKGVPIVSTGEFNLSEIDWRVPVAIEVLFSMRLWNTMSPNGLPSKYKNKASWSRFVVASWEGSFYWDIEGHSNVSKHPWPSAFFCTINGWRPQNTPKFSNSSTSSGWIKMGFIQRLPKIRFPLSAGWSTYHLKLPCGMNGCLGSWINLRSAKPSIDQNSLRGYLPFLLTQWKKLKQQSAVNISADSDKTKLDSLRQKFQQQTDEDLASYQAEIFGRRKTKASKKTCKKLRECLPSPLSCIPIEVKRVPILKK